MTVPLLRNHALRYKALIAALVLGVLIAGGLFFYTSRSTPYAHAQAIQNARQEWEQRPFTRYQLAVMQRRHQPQSLLPRLTPHYTIGDEQAARNVSNSQERSITELFDLIEHYPRTTDYFCAGLNFECKLPVTYDVVVEYDSELGYPRTIRLSRTSHPAWFDTQFWGWYWQSESWQSCDNPLCITTETETIQIQVQPE